MWGGLRTALFFVRLRTEAIIQFLRASVAAAACAVILLTGMRADAQTPVPAPIDPNISVELGSWRLRTEVSALMASAQLINLGTDALLNKATGDRLSDRKWSGWLLRGAKLMSVDLPLVAVSHTLAHEMSHLARDQYDRVSHGPIHITQWPWPVPFMDARTTANFFAFDVDDVRLLGHAAAGDEAGSVRDALLADSLQVRGKLNYVEAAQLIYSRLETPGAAWKHLADATFTSEDDFFGGPYAATDSRTFLRTFEFIRRPKGVSLSQLRSEAGVIRHGSLLALADLQLWGSLARLVSYVRTGDIDGPLPSIRIADAQIWPRATFALTARGIARGANALVRTPDFSYDLYLTQTVAPSQQRLWDGSVRVASHLSIAPLAHAQVALWQQENRPLGGAAEVGWDWRRSAGKVPATLGVSVGYKTDGYLAGAPDKASWFASINLGLLNR